MRMLFFCSLTFFLLPQPLLAQPIDGGVFSRTGCLAEVDGSPSLCLPSQTSVNINDDQTPGTGLAATQLGDPGMGEVIQAAASVGYEGGSLTPTISAYADVPANTVFFSSVNWGFQKYTMTGTQLTIDGELTYSHSAQNTAEGVMANAGIFAFQMTGDTFSLDQCLLNGNPVTPGHLVFFCIIGLDARFELSGMTAYQEGIFEEITGDNPLTLDATSNASLTINGSPGDIWFVGSFIHFLGNLPGSFFDARNTLNVSFADSSQVSPSLASEFPSPTFVKAPPPGSADELIEDLIFFIGDLDLKKGLENQLNGMLMAALEELLYPGGAPDDDEDSDEPRTATEWVEAFTKKVEIKRGKHIDDAVADVLIARALAILSSIPG